MTTPWTSLRGCGMIALIALQSLLLAPAAQAQDITISVYGSLAPNGFGSPSWRGYTSNAMVGLQNNLATVGDPTQPTYYARTSTIASGRNLIVTNFNSWLGQAEPGSVFGPQFAAELGNRVHFGVHVSSSGAPFTLSQLNYAVDAKIGGGLKLDFSGAFDVTDSYGVLSSGSIIIGRTADGQIIDSGPATQAVTDLWYTGVGNAFSVLSSDPGATDQEKIENVLADNPKMLQPFTITGEYWLTKKPGGKGGLVTPKVGGTVTVNPAGGTSSASSTPSSRLPAGHPHR